MANPKEANDQPKRRVAPGTTPEARENQMITLAIELAEKQLSEGTASSQVITHYLKLGTTREHLEKEILHEQKELLKAKTEAIQSSKNSEAAYLEVLKAMRRYSGQGSSEEDA